MWFKKPCKNCGSKKLTHVCYRGGDKSSIFYDDEARKRVEEIRILNTSRGDDPFKGVPKELRSAYMNQRPRP